MANGIQGSQEELSRLEAQLKTLDSELSEYAVRQSMSLTKNYHSWPERSLTWTEGNKKLIQIYLVDGDPDLYNLWACASKDKDGKRYWRQEYLIKEQPFEVIKSRLPDLLRQARSQLESWGDSELTEVTTLKP